jgi:hypothetical protein
MNNTARKYTQDQKHLHARFYNDYQGEVVEFPKQQVEKHIPSDKDMTLGEKILMNALVWIPFTWVAYMFMKHFFG